MDTRVAPARSVRIAVPAYAGLSDDTRRSIIEGAKALVQAGIEIEDADGVMGCCYVDYARNQLVARFLRGAATDLVFIDSDVGFEPDALLRLCQSTRPLVAGIYPKKIDPPEWPVALDAAEVWSDREGLVECSMLPTGFMRIHRSVFEAMDVPRYAIPGEGEAGAYFQCVVRDGQYIGEDVEFCHRYRALGGKLYAFADMDLRHVGHAKTFRGNWSHWLKEQMKEAA